MLYMCVIYKNLTIQIMSNLSNDDLYQENQIGLSNINLVINLSSERMNIQISLKYPEYICISRMVLPEKLKT